MTVIRLLLTAIIVVLAVFGIVYIWNTYFEAPWTRDADIRADIVEIASYVSGQVVSVNVHDNQHVEKGQVLVQIDRTDYCVAVEQAKASVAQDKAKVAKLEQQAARLTSLDKKDSAAVSTVKVRNAQLEAEAAKAALDAAKAKLDSAKVKLGRTTITAPTSGYIANLTVDTGDYANAGKALLAVIDEDSYRVQAFFMETQIPQVKIGAHARIKLMAGGQTLEGTVKGIAHAVHSSQNTSSNLLANPSSTFQWIRLAQRIPVEIELSGKPNFPLVSGMSATVVLDEASSSSAFDRLIPGWFDD
ncbi:efflux RND transporter periplasmic adaptor subunit [Pararhizobium mangrovi]|uniref:efflux RND transporter periplasmic adaptor subunit n=1 Tax=Pararhizobium mangrovi TaxID=2590452 RepID=UPI0015E85D0A|nr:HlyD family secretion protein [Pararhizobium mangrovi]